MQKAVRYRSTNNQSRSRWHGRKLVSTLVSMIVTFVVTFLAFVYGQRLVDYVIASRYQPTEQITSIAARVQLADYGKTVFYASQPVVESQDQFNQSCESTERSTAMLGCYYRRQIYLFNVTNKDLDGVIEVTAAHEMLHAAYERLPFYERPQIDRLVNAEYQKIKDDPEIATLMKYYAQTEPGQLDNELHSIIGTTIRDVSPELERYYQQYFANRQSIVKMNEAYNAVFEKAKQEADQLNVKINREGPAIQSALVQYDANKKQIETDVEVFNSRAKNGDFKTQASFDVTRDALLARVDELNVERDRINARVDVYNKLIEQYNAVSLHTNELNRSINGISAPAESKL